MVLRIASLSPVQTFVVVTPLLLWIWIKNFRQVDGSSETSSQEEMQIHPDTARLETGLAQLRDILGDEAPREKLVQVLLAGDYDINRAINYYYTSISQ